MARAVACTGTPWRNDNNGTGAWNEKGLLRTICPHVRRYTNSWYAYLPTYLSTYLPTYPSIHPSIYSSIYLPIYLSIYLPVCKSCEPILAAEPSNTIDSLFVVGNFPARFWIFQNQMYRFRASCVPRVSLSSSSLCFPLCVSNFENRAYAKGYRETSTSLKDFFFLWDKVSRRNILSSFCSMYEERLMRIDVTFIMRKKWKLARLLYRNDTIRKFKREINK